MVMWITLIVYVCVMLGIGFYCRRKTNSVSEFVLGGRSIGPWMTAFAYGTSYFSAVVFIGYAGQFGWNYGLAATWIGIGNALIGSLLAWAVLGNRTRVMTKHLNVSTMPEYFEKRYVSRGLKLSSALIVFVFLIPYTASVYNGLSRLFEQAFHIDYSICIVVMAVLTAVYVILGGYMATAINDFIQGIIMLGGIAAVVVCVLSNQGGISSALLGLGQISDAGVPQNTLNTLFGPDPINLFGVVILTSLGTWGLPQMVHKFYAIKDKPAIRRGAVISTIFALFVAGGSYFIGGFGRLFTTAGEIASPETGKPVFDMIMPTLLNKAVPELLFGIVVVLVLSASMSTLSSLVLTSSSTLTIDMILPFMKKRGKEAGEKKKVFIMRIFIAAFILLSVIIALNKNTYITTLMSISWGALAGAFLAPFLYGLFSRKVTKTACWASFICGVGITVVSMFLFNLGFFPELTKAAASLPLNLASPINWGAIAMIAGLVLVPLVSLFTKNKKQAQIDEVYDSYKKELKTR